MCTIVEVFIHIASSYIVNYAFIPTNNEEQHVTSPRLLMGIHSPVSPSLKNAPLKNLLNFASAGDLLLQGVFRIRKN